MNKEQIIDEVYKNYLNEWTFEKYPNDGSVYSVEPIKVKEHSKEQFVYRCKTDNEFSEKWGLKIEKRELSYKERLSCLQNILDKTDIKLSITNETTYEQLWDYYNVPTKLIIITYNDIKTEIYE